MFRIKKLNNQGFAHHFLIPVIAIIVIAGIGTYIVTKSKASTLPGGGGASWKEKSADYPKDYVYGHFHDYYGMSVAYGKQYRACFTIRTEGAVPGQIKLALRSPSDTPGYYIGYSAHVTSVALKDTVYCTTPYTNKNYSSLGATAQPMDGHEYYIYKISWQVYQ